MYRLRSSFVRRGVASLAVVCLLGMSVAPSFAHRATYTSYGDWLRTQVTGDVNEQFDQALQRASADRAPSIERFLHAFIETWAEVGDIAALGAVFGLEGLDDALLISYLQSRFSGLTPDALPARILLTVPSSIAASGADRGIAIQHDGDLRLHDTRAAVAELSGFVEGPNDPRFLLSSMPRLGP